MEFDEFATAGADDVHIDIGGRVFGVGEVEDGRAFENADTNCGYLANNRICADHTRFNKLSTCQRKRNVRTCDRSATRAAVGLDDVAIEIYLAFAQQFCVNDRPHTATDQTLYLLRSPRRPVFGFTLSSGICCPWEHGVFSRYPAETFVSHKHRHAILDRCRADHLCPANLDQRRTLSIWRNIRRNFCITKLVVISFVWSFVSHNSLAETRTVVRVFLV